MFGQQQQQQWDRKRGREDDEDFGASGFGEHRTKRRIAALPHRMSPSMPRSQLCGVSQSYLPPPQAQLQLQMQHQQEAPPTITPVDSDEDTPVEAKSFFSPYSSSPYNGPSPSSPLFDPSSSSQRTQMSDIGQRSDDVDMDMSDVVHFSPGSIHNGLSNTITGRIPTPIHSSFAPYVRADKTARQLGAGFVGGESMMGSDYPRNKRLPSPISEGEMSPSVIVEGLGEMQMEVEHEIQTPSKKGHRRSPHASTHSLRSWSGFGGGTGFNNVGNGDGTGQKRSFSMGYRAECEKCRNRVPNHFSHIIYE